MRAYAELKLPFEIVKVAGTEVVNAVKSIEQEHAGRASVAVLGSTDELFYLNQQVLREQFADHQEVLRRTAFVDFPAAYRDWLREELESLREEMKAEYRAGSPILEQFDFGLPSDQPIGDWPSTPVATTEIQGFMTAQRGTRKPYMIVLVGVFPTKDWTEIPAYFSFGGWNTCPSPEWHVAALRYWKEKWGARLLGISHDTIEIIVDRVPETRKAAIELAKEQYDYCDDLVDQGYSTVGRLAQFLMSSRRWWFWWD